MKSTGTSLLPFDKGNYMLESVGEAQGAGKNVNCLGSLTETSLETGLLRPVRPLEVLMSPGWDAGGLL